MSDTDFCTNCGKPVDPHHDVYCPNCGAPVKGGPGDIAAQAAYKEATKNTVVWAGIFLFIAALPSLILGIDYVVNDSSIATSIWNGMSDTTGISFDQLLEYVKDLGYVEVVVGIIGILGAVLCFLHKYWWAVVIITLVVLFFGVFSFIGIFLGLFAMWFVFISRDGFES